MQDRGRGKATSANQTSAKLTGMVGDTSIDAKINGTIVTMTDAISKRAYLDTATINRIREIDLLTYLRQISPNDLYQRSTEYRLHSTPRFWISNGKWYDHDSEQGGVSALDYLVKVKGIPFLEAAHMILDGGLPNMPIPPPQSMETVPKAFQLPERNTTNDCVMHYLTGRGVHAEVVRQCIRQGILYESKRYNNCVFVGLDPEGAPRYAAIRGTLGNFRAEVAGSMKRYGFAVSPHDLYDPRAPGSPSHKISDTHALSSPPHNLCDSPRSSGPLHNFHSPRAPCSELAIFESPIDLLSHISLSPRENVYRLALGGTSSKALMQFVADHPNIRTVYACLDNDEAGRTATQKLRAMLPKQYHFIDHPPLEGKDYNDFLLLTQHRDRQMIRRSATRAR